MKPEVRSILIGRQKAQDAARLVGRLRSRPALWRISDSQAYLAAAVRHSQAARKSGSERLRARKKINRTYGIKKTIYRRSGEHDLRETTQHSLLREKSSPDLRARVDCVVCFSLVRVLHGLPRVRGLLQAESVDVQQVHDESFVIPKRLFEQDNTLQLIWPWCASSSA